MNDLLAQGSSPPSIAWSIAFAMAYLVVLVAFGRLSLFARNPFAGPAMHFWLAIAILPVIGVSLNPAEFVPIAPVIGWCRHYILDLLVAVVVVGMVMNTRIRQSHIARLRSALERCDDLDQRIDLTALLERYGQYDDAIAAHEKTIESQPGHGDPKVASAARAKACVALAALMGRRQRFDRAEQVCHRAIELDASNAHAHFYLGMALLERGERKAARREFVRSRELGIDQRYAGLVDSMIAKCGDG